jgi:hypothetical protein
MGMFDEVRCKYPMPVKQDFSDQWFQTKSLDCFLDKYEIREDGTLWECEYNGGGDWVQVKCFTGEIRFYRFHSELVGQRGNRGWVEFSSYFVRGELKQLELITFDTEEATECKTNC